MKRFSVIGLSLIGFTGSLFCLMVGVAVAGQPTLIQQWETERVMEVPESILCDPSETFFYVSNISGKPKEKNGRGFIAKVSMAGKVINLKWATGLNAPKGMALHGDILYVSDIDHLVAIRVSDGSILKRYPAPGARFLNDVAADAQGRVYVSDSSKKNSVIYRFSDGVVSRWLSGAGIKKPNGLFMRDGQLLVGNSGDGTIKAVQLSTKAVATLATVGSGIDGLQPDGNGNFIVSDWKGKTSCVHTDGTTVMLLNTTDQKINAADLDYVPAKNLLLIPTFFDNRVVAYQYR